MELLNEILREAGCDMDRAFTVLPGFGAYFKSVKRVEDFSEEKIVLAVGKRKLVVTGNGLTVDKYFQQDLFVKGDVTGVVFE